MKCEVTERFPEKIVTVEDLPQGTVGVIAEAGRSGQVGTVVLRRGNTIVALEGNLILDMESADDREYYRSFKVRLFPPGTKITLTVE